MKLTCDLCGGSLEMKNGNAVCVNCGLSYSMETLREKINKPNSAEPPKPAPDKTPVASASYTNLLNLATLEFNNKNHKKVIDICDQVLASDYANKDAWQLKIRSSDVVAAASAYQAYLAAQQNEADRALAAAFGKSYFGSLEVFQEADLVAIFKIFPEIANAFANKNLKNATSSVNEKITEIKAAQNWEKNNKPSSAHQNNEKTYGLRTKYSDHLRWFDVGFAERYSSFAAMKGSDVDENLAAYCSAVLTWLDLIVDFKYWDGEFHHRETVSVYTTKYYYHKYKLIPLFYDTSWEYGACNRFKAAVTKIHSSVSKQLQEKAAKRKEEQERQIKKRKEEYWAAHPEEKQQLQQEKADLSKQIDLVRAEFKESAEVKLLKESEEALTRLKQQLGALGAFKFKEKKALNAQIKDQELALASAQKALDECEYRKNNQIKELKSRILKIDDRLNLIGVKL